jgi:hypothetical protein
VSCDNQFVTERDRFEIELVRLPGGDRLLRLADPMSGLALERKLDAARPVHDQKQQLLGIFERALKDVQLTAA